MATQEIATSHQLKRRPPKKKSPVVCVNLPTDVPTRTITPK
ncbi:MAG: hypothetical protein ACYSUA_18295 [Planctomycetota bacterium]